MNEGRELWKKYCGFLDKSFSEQIEYSEKKKEEYFEEWKKTKMAEQLCPEGVDKFEDIPLTTYKDYPILKEFGKKIEYLSETVPRKEGELSWDYWDRISKQVAPMLANWMVGEYALCQKTTGTGGESKWFAHNKEFAKFFAKYALAAPIMACSDEWGDTKIKKGDKILHAMAPAPYGSGEAVRTFERLFVCVPPNQIMENITDMRKKMDRMVRVLKSGEEIAYISAIPATSYSISQYLTAPAKVFKDKYESMKPGMAKFVLYLKYLQSKLNPSRYQRVSELIQIRGLTVAATGYGLYLEPLKEQYNVDPCNLYVSSEGGIVMTGSLKRKENLIPLLENDYFEFMTKDGEIKKIDELEKGRVYTLIVTPCDGMLVRCNSGDAFRLVDFERNGLPILSFESRVVSLINIYGYLYLSETLAGKLLTKAGLGATDAWAIAKLTEPTEHLLLLMEKEWDYSEEEASRALFDALKEISEDFRNLIRDFRIEQPTKFIEVEYLEKGAFMRYTMKRAKEGVPYGQMKIPKLINPEQSKVIDILRNI